MGSSVSTANLRTATPQKSSGLLERPAAPETETKIYPNPARETATVSMDGSIPLAHILVHNMNGQLMQQLNPTVLKTDHGKYQLPLLGLPQGVYLISLVGEQQMISQHKLMVRQ